MDIELSFVDSISEAYKQKLQTFVDNVLAQGLNENRPPDITFPGINEASYNDIQKLLDDYYEKWEAHTM